MPLTPHEQRILEEIEKRLAEEDPRLVESVAKTTVTRHALTRVRWGITGFVAGFVLLLFFVISMWFAVGGFVLMLVSAMVTIRHLKRMGQDQLRSFGQRGSHLSITAALARLAERLRRPPSSG